VTQSTADTLKKLETRRRQNANLGSNHPRAGTLSKTPEEILASGRIPLTEQQAKFVRATAEGMPPASAARSAGYSNPSMVANKLLKNPVLQAGILAVRRKFEADAAMSRKKVIDGLSEAIVMAKIQGDPTAMIMGWRELGRMCGYYEAIKHKVEVSVSGQVTHQSIKALPDEELLRLADEGAATGRLFEGEAVRAV
jgi:phage terminase small subunit